ncbi:hypothetical protein OG909_00865 [Streptomyces sp. NBC_01754]|uniref:hypothetical protein n=1 Tax=Streptomyces sp. NBC_01754 TaxID=2975930 RepID=UPI002DD8B2B4|nr:hypothetical protein [Streptomyces sp. NBC_01754]WSC90973.1 hypothetical protein OG909_00865 [Streptomyces sp. NBC_01754]
MGQIGNMYDGIVGREPQVDSAVRAEAAQLIEQGDSGEVDARMDLGLEPHPAHTSEAVAVAAQASRAALRTLDSPWAVYGAQDARLTLAAAMELLYDAQKAVVQVLLGISTAQDRGDISDNGYMTRALATAHQMAERLPGTGRHELAQVFDALAGTEPQQRPALPRTANQTLEQTQMELRSCSELRPVGDESERVSGFSHALDLRSRTATWSLSYHEDELEWGAVMHGGRPGEMLVQGESFVLLPVGRPDVHPVQMAALVRQYVPGMAEV